MKFSEIKTSDISSVTGAALRERLKVLGKTPNCVFIEKKKDKDSIEYRFQVPATFREKNYLIKIKKAKEDLYVFCSCESFLLQGFAYRCWSSGCGILKETREDKRWSKYHKKNSFLCKHLYVLFNKQDSYLLKYIKEDQK